MLIPQISRRRQHVEGLRKLSGPGRETKGSPEPYSEPISCKKGAEQNPGCLQGCLHVLSLSQQQNHGQNNTGVVMTPGRLATDTQGPALFNHGRRDLPVIQNHPCASLSPAAPAIPQPTTQPCLPPGQQLQRDPAGTLHGFAHLPVHRRGGRGGLHTLAKRAALRASLTWAGEGGSCRSQGQGERSSSSFSPRSVCARHLLLTLGPAAKPRGAAIKPPRLAPL